MMNVTTVEHDTSIHGKFHGIAPHAKGKFLIISCVVPLSSSWIQPGSGINVALKLQHMATASLN